MEWISVKDRLPKYDPKDERAFKYFFRANNERYYTGYTLTGYGKTAFFQHNGREILNVTHWAEIEPPKTQQHNGSDQNTQRHER